MRTSDVGSWFRKLEKVLSQFSGLLFAETFDQLEKSFNRSWRFRISSPNFWFEKFVQVSQHSWSLVLGFRRIPSGIRDMQPLTKIRSLFSLLKLQALDMRKCSVDTNIRNGKNSQSMFQDFSTRKICKRMSGSWNLEEFGSSGLWFLMPKTILHRFTAYLHKKITINSQNFEFGLRNSKVCQVSFGNFSKLDLRLDIFQVLPLFWRFRTWKKRKVSMFVSSSPIVLRKLA